MAEYIEIGQLWKCETCYRNGQYGCALGLGCDHGENYRPAYCKLKKADVAPVVRGKWVISSDGYYPYCSECKNEPKHGEKTNYCPRCGARMDGE